MDNSIRKLVRYTGRVQGVGFRMTTKWIARRFDVTGYVKNLADGRVELAAEGSPAEVEAFLAEVREKKSFFIQSEQVSTQPPRGDATFVIAH